MVVLVKFDRGFRRCGSQPPQCLGVGPGITKLMVCLSAKKIAVMLTMGAVRFHEFQEEEIQKLVRENRIEFLILFPN